MFTKSTKESNRPKPKKLTIFLVLILFGVFLAWVTGVFMQNNKIKNYEKESELLFKSLSLYPQTSIKRDCSPVEGACPTLTAKAEVRLSQDQVEEYVNKTEKLFAENIIAGYTKKTDKCDFYQTEYYCALEMVGSNNFSVSISETLVSARIE
jgi:hypothetical protein